MARILISRRWPAAVDAEIAARHDLSFDASDRALTESDLIDAMQQFDVICPTVSDLITAQIIEAPRRRARILANFGAGVDHIDCAAARRAGLVITNTPDVLTDATAELAILLILMTMRRAEEGARELRNGHWAGWRPTHLLGRGLAGRTLGLFGFGRIAKATARRARGAFGMQILYTSRQRATFDDEQSVAATYVPTLSELASRADVLSLHCPSTPETRGIIDSALLQQIPRDAVLINTARGAIVNEADLARALSEGRIAAAGLDTFAREPMVHPALLQQPNAVLLPHLGSATIETRTAMGRRAVANFEAFLAGQEPRDRVT